MAAMTGRRYRGFIAEADRLGVTVLSVEHGRHAKFRLRNCHGVEGTIPVSLSQTTARSGVNARAQLRRFANATPHEDRR